MPSHDRVRRAARGCGPAAIASILGVTRAFAAIALLGREPGRRCRFYLESLRDVLRPRVSSAVIVPYRKPRPTLSEWLRLHAGKGHAVVFAGGHFYHVHDGEIVEDNGVTQMRARVKGVLYVTL